MTRRDDDHHPIEDGEQDDPLRGIARKHDGYGIGLDQAYTDALIEMLTPDARRAQLRPNVTGHGVTRGDLLTTLLLFGRAYLARPLWLTGTDLPQLETFQREGLISWIPERFYSAAFSELDGLVSSLQIAAKLSSVPRMVRMDQSGNLLEREYFFRQLRHDLEIDDALHECEVRMRYAFDCSPLVAGNLRHLGYDDIDPTYPLIFPIEQHVPSAYPTDAFVRVDGRDPYYWFERLHNGSFYGRLDDLRSNANGFAEGVAGEYFDIQAAVLDGALASIGIERFAATTHLPLKTRDGHIAPQFRTIVHDDAAYDLIRIQVDELYYPHVTSIDDVLRLRQHPHFEQYRRVITEYSAHMAGEVEQERTQILHEFRRDIRLAVRDLKGLAKFERAATLAFYLSIPLAMVGLFKQLPPISDLVGIPTTLAAKVAARHRKKKHEWLLFGRPDAF